MSIFALTDSFFGAVAAGCGTVFTFGTDFCRSPFLTTVAHMLFEGYDGGFDVILLLASGAFRRGFARRIGRMGGEEAVPVATYCAIAVRRSSA